DPGDVLVGAALGLTIAVALPPHRADRSSADRVGPIEWVGAFAGMLIETAREMVVGSWRVVRFCLGAQASPGFVEIPRNGRSRESVALWGVLTGEAPDEVPVDVDEERDVLIVHLVDVGDPDAVRTRHQRAYERWQRRVVR
ncbi:MAG: Na+/H+ antiporter subunit E, partial [Candidatus Limnocylindrales bacterium]